MQLVYLFCTVILCDVDSTGVFLYLRPYHNPWIKKAKKLLGCAQDFRLENWILVEWIDKTQTLPKLSLENLGRVCVLPIHSTTFQFSNLKSWAHPYNFFAFLIHGLWFGRSYKNRPVVVLPSPHWIVVTRWQRSRSRSLVLEQKFGAGFVSKRR